ncbi:hypothetical protein GCM10010191_39070 [Actinomadura vinacea]|uniref:DUF2567 domain-containing protein n=1 Tax=Actinomadura vinacea TaxID=115336 RepID=A0ABN3J6K9_9ACTN
MSILRHGTAIRGPATRLLMLGVPKGRRVHPPAVPAAPSPSPGLGASASRPASAVRALASMLMLGSALFYLAVAVQGVGELLLGPPPEMVTTANELAAGTEGTAATSGGQDVDMDVLLRPLALTGAALAGLTLLWCGTRGLWAAHDQRRWRRRQLSGLVGLGVGTLAFALGLTAAETGAEAYVQAVWNGVEPIRPSAVLALLVGSVALLVRAPRRAFSN